ncbi:MAG: hypothetical protein ACRELF_03060 [Gemmataceae bacterium]
MIDDVSLIVPRVVAAETATPALEMPSGEATLPAPTAEQAQSADRVFAAPTAPHPVSSMFGIAASILLLRDVAIDTFDTSGDDDDEEEAKKPSEKDQDADCTD